MLPLMSLFFCAESTVQTCHQHKTLNLRPDRTSKTLAAATRAILTESDDDCECEDVSKDEQAFHAARSTFGGSRRKE